MTNRGTRVFLSKEEIEALRIARGAMDKIVKEASDAISMESLARDAYFAGVEHADANVGADRAQALDNTFNFWWNEWLRRNKMR